MPLPNSPKPIVVGTRGSALALAQSRAIVAQLKKANPKLKIRIQKIITSGDRLKTKSLADHGGKGLFVKEIEEALLKKKIDVAVHSLKDMPSHLPKGLMLACFPKREDPRDCLISRKFKSLEGLPKKARVGTSSPRRVAWLKFLRPDLKLKPIRGNVESRLKKMETKKYDALILAAAGLKRLKKSRQIRMFFEVPEMIPAIGQGQLGIEIRAKDAALKKILQKSLQDRLSFVAATVERSFLKAIGGDCYTPLGGHAMIIKNRIRFLAFLASPDGKTVIRLERWGLMVRPEALGREMAEAILHVGGREILNAIAGH